MKDSTLESLEAVAGPVSRETFSRLQSYERTFLKWSAHINLAAPSTLPELWRRHILDSVQLAPLGRGATHWLDLGSGGGFPGAVLAILLAERPDTRVDLIESNGKKAAFLKTTLGALGVKALVHAERIETVYGQIPVPDVVTARALAPLQRLFALAEPWLTAGSRGLFHKGREFATEIKESAADWRYDLVKHDSRIEPGTVILEITNLSRR